MQQGVRGGGTNCFGDGEAWWRRIVLILEGSWAILGSIDRFRVHETSFSCRNLKVQNKAQYLPIFRGFKTRFYIDGALEESMVALTCKGVS